jgi:hypothetical protein
MAQEFAIEFDGVMQVPPTTFRTNPTNVRI